MTRGASLKGLSGIPKVRDYIIRPTYQYFKGEN